MEKSNVRKVMESPGIEKLLQSLRKKLFNSECNTMYQRIKTDKGTFGTIVIKTSDLSIIRSIKAERVRVLLKGEAVETPKGAIFRVPIKIRYPKFDDFDTEILLDITNDTTRMQIQEDFQRGRLFLLVFSDDEHVVVMITFPPNEFQLPTLFEAILDYNQTITYDFQKAADYVQKHFQIWIE